MAVSAIPRGKGLTPYVRQALTKTVRNARAVPFSQLRLEHFRQSKNKVMHWPLTELKPPETLRELDPRGALLIFNMMHYRFGIAITDFIIYKYLVNFDDFGGFKKFFLWRGVDCNALARSNKNAYLSQDNLFVFYVNRPLGREFPLPKDGSDARDYHWIEEARSAFRRFPLPSAVKVIGDSDILCPKEEEI
jgi:hypothetical protein